MDISSSLFVYILTLTQGYSFFFILLILEREERGRETDRQTDRQTSMWERNVDWLSLVRTLTGNWNCTFWCMGRCSNQLSHPNWGEYSFTLKATFLACLWSKYFFKKTLLEFFLLSSIFPFLQFYQFDDYFFLFFKLKDSFSKPGLLYSA